MGKKVFLLLMFCIFFGPRALMAQTPIPKITGNAVINEDVIITLAGDDPVPMAGAITVGAGQSVTLDPGAPDAVVKIIVEEPINTWYSPHSAIYATGGGQVVLGRVDISTTTTDFTNTILITTGLYASGQDSLISLGDDSEITIGNGGAAAFAISGAEIVIGEQAYLKGTVWGNASATVSSGTGYNGSGGTITIGNGATIINDGSSSALGPVNPYGDNQAVHATGGGTITIGDQATIQTVGGTSGRNHAVVAGLHIADRTIGTVRIGREADITADGNNSWGLGAYLNGSLLAVGEESKITVNGQSGGIGAAAVIGGRIEIGAGSQILVNGDDASGLTADSQNFPRPQYYGPSTIDAGDRVSVTTTGDRSTGVTAMNYNGYGHGSEITLGQDNLINTAGDDSYGLMAYGYDTVIKAGDGLKATTSGQSAHAAVAVNNDSAVGLNDDGPQITLGGNVQLATSGDEAYGLLAEGQGAFINVASGLDLKTTGLEAFGALALDGGRINLAGGSLAVNGDLTSAAVTAQGQAGLLSEVRGQGQFHILGNLAANDYGALDFELTDGSYFRGTASLTDTESYNNLALKGSSTVWEPTGDARLSSLALDGAQVDLRSTPTPTTITTDRLSGSGNFILKTDLAASQGDLIEVTGEAHGNHVLTIANSGAADTTGAEVLTVVTAADGSAVFTLDSAVECGAWEYNLTSLAREFNATHWQLSGTRNLTSTASGAMNVFSGAYLLLDAENRTLRQRLGDLRHDGEKFGFWTRGYTGRFESGEGRYVKAYDMKYRGLQLGVDHFWPIESPGGNDWGKLYAGAALGYGRGDLDYGRTGEGKVDMKTAALYAAWMGPSGFYADLTGRGAWMENNFQVLDSRDQKVTGRPINTRGLGASLEVGRQIGLWEQNGNRVYLEPNVQYSFDHQNGGSFTASNGLEVEVAGFNSNRLRAGANLGYTYQGPENRIDVYTKASYVKEYDGDVDIKANASRLNETFGADRWLYGLGLSVNFSRRHDVFVDLERSAGGRIKEPFALTGGFRFTF